MARPPKSGLTYFPLDVDLFDDPKIIRLVEQNDTDGLAVYIAALCIIYRGGYYTDLPRDLLCAQIAKMIGSRRLGARKVEEILRGAAALGLFFSPESDGKVLTSRSIQKRYAEITARNKVDTSKFWLLPSASSNGEGGTIPSDRVSATETPVFAAETGISATETPQNEMKQNKTTPYNPPRRGRREKEVKAQSFDLDAAFKIAEERTYGKDFLAKERIENGGKKNGN